MDPTAEEQDLAASLLTITVSNFPPGGIAPLRARMLPDAREHSTFCVRSDSDAPERRPDGRREPQVVMDAAELRSKGREAQGAAGAGGICVHKHGGQAVEPWVLRTAVKGARERAQTVREPPPRAPCFSVWEPKWTWIAGEIKKLSSFGVTLCLSGVQCYGQGAV